MASKTGTPTFIASRGESETYSLIRSFIYGHPGSGKTVLAASSCEVENMSPVLLIDCDTSSDTIIGEERFRDVDVIRIADFDEISGVHTWLVKEGLEEKGYGTIIIDEVAELHWKTLNMLMKKNIKENPNRDYNDLWLNDYGDARRIMRNIVDAFLNLNTHFILTSLVRIGEDLVDGREYRMPGIPGQLKDELPAKMSLYIYLDTELPSQRDLKAGDSLEGKRLAYFQETRRFKAKVRGLERAERLGSVMENPTMYDIYQLYVGE